MKFKCLILSLIPVFLLTSCTICIGQCNNDPVPDPQEGDPEDEIPEEERKYLVDRATFKKYDDLDIFMESRFEAVLTKTTVRTYDRTGEVETTVEVERNLFDLEKWHIIQETKEFMYIRFEEERARVYENYDNEIGWKYKGTYNFLWRNGLKRDKTLYLDLDYDQLVYSTEIHAYTYLNKNRLVDADDIVIQFENNLWKHLEFSYDDHYNNQTLNYHISIDTCNWNETTVTEPVIES